MAHLRGCVCVCVRVWFTDWRFRIPKKRIRNAAKECAVGGTVDINLVLKIFHIFSFKRAQRRFLHSTSEQWRTTEG